MVYLPTFTTNFKPNAGKYISYMDPMGCLIFFVCSWKSLVYHCFRHLWLVSGVKLMETNSNLSSRLFDFLGFLKKSSIAWCGETQVLKIIDRLLLTILSWQKQARDSHSLNVLGHHFFKSLVSRCFTHFFWKLRVYHQSQKGKFAHFF